MHLRTTREELIADGSALSQLVDVHSYGKQMLGLLFLQKSQVQKRRI
jgi:hypothetical protein